MRFQYILSSQQRLILRTLRYYIRYSHLGPVHYPVIVPGAFSLFLTSMSPQRHFVVKNLKMFIRINTWHSKVTGRVVIGHYLTKKRAYIDKTLFMGGSNAAILNFIDKSLTPGQRSNFSVTQRKQYTVKTGH